jgi:hypothetical protein
MKILLITFTLMNLIISFQIKRIWEHKPDMPGTIGSTNDVVNFMTNLILKFQENWFIEFNEEYMVINNDSIKYNSLNDFEISVEINEKTWEKMLQFYIFIDSKIFIFELISDDEIESNYVDLNTKFESYFNQKLIKALQLEKTALASINQEGFEKKCETERLKEELITTWNNYITIQ